MNQDQVAEAVRKILVKQQQLTLKDVQLSSRLQEDLGVESFDAIELMFEFENTFNVTIPDEAIPVMKTVQDVVDFVLKQQAGQQQTRSTEGHADPGPSS